MIMTRENQKTWLIIFGIGGFLLLILWLHASYYLPFISDDALISLRYSQRLLQGFGLTWTDGSQPVEGYSNLLWVLLAAMLGWFGMDLVDAVRLLGFMSMAGTLTAIFYAYSHPTRPLYQSLPAIVAGISLVTAGPIAVWTIGGLEQPLVIVFLVWGLVLCYPLLENQPVRIRQVLLPGLSFALLLLSRLDAGIFLATTLLTILIVRGINKESIRLVFLLGLLPAVFLLAQIGFRYLYYGEWIPNTALVKVSLSRIHLIEGLQYIWGGWISLLPLSFFAVVFALVCFWDSNQRKRILLIGLPAVVWLGYIALVGGDIFPGWRHITPVIALMALLLAEGMVWLQKRISTRTQKVLFILVLAASLAVFIWSQFDNTENKRAKKETWEWDGEVIGLMLKHGFGKQQALMAVDPAGCLPYWSELPAVDMMGLNDYYIPRNPPPDFGQGYIGHELGDGNYVLGREPDLIVFCSPKGGYEPCFRSGKEMQAGDTFHQLYTPVVFEGRLPYTQQSIIWVRQFSPKIGIQKTPDRIEIPAYLLNGNPDSVAHLDGSNNFVTSISPDIPAKIMGLEIPPGKWRVDAEATGEVQATLIKSDGETYLLKSTPLPAEFLQDKDGPRNYDITFSSPDGETTLRRVVLTKITD